MAVFDPGHNCTAQQSRPGPPKRPQHLWLLGLSTVGCVIFLGILQGLKEGLFAAVDAIPDFRKTAAFEDGLEKLKPLLEGGLSSVAALKCLQHGEVEHYCAM